MPTISPSSFGITGSGFTANGTVTIEVLNSSGAVVATSTTTADSSGGLSATLDSSILSGLIPSSGGSVSGYVVAIDTFTNAQSNKVQVSLSQSQQSNVPSFMSWPQNINNSGIGFIGPSSVGYTITEVANSMPNFQIYASLNSDMSGAVLVGGAAVTYETQGYTPAEYEASGQMPIYPALSELGLPSSWQGLMYFIAIDTVNQTRSSISSSAN